MASRSEGDPAALSPIPEPDDPDSVFEVLTAVARYDAVTTQVAIADLAPLLRAAQPTSMVPALVRPAAMAVGSVVSHPVAAPVAEPRRRRIGLALFVAAIAAAVWAIAGYEVWYLFLR